MVKVTAAAIGAISIAAAVVASAEPPAGAAACSGCHPASTHVDVAGDAVGRARSGRDRQAMQDFRSGLGPAPS